MIITILAALCVAFAASASGFTDDLPSAADGLNVMLKQPARQDTSWKGPYLEKEPRDAWGQPLVYVYPGKHNTDSFDIVSAGPDHVPGKASAHIRSIW